MSNRRKRNVGRDNKKNKPGSREYLMKKAAIAKIVVFSVMLLTGMVISFMMPLRPRVSESENRVLAAFPQFKVESFMDGTYFGEIDRWYSDTFPFRDGLLACNDKFTSLYGIRDSVVHGEIVAGDDIPDVDLDDIMNPGTDKGEDVYEDSDYADDDIVTDTTEDKGETFGSILVYGDSAYEYYVYSQKNADTYVNVVNNLAAKLTGKASFHNVIIPVSMDITLPDSIRSGITTSDQRKAILYMYSKMGSAVNKTFIFDMLKSHNSEYIYFRTDHHWTSLAAYYTYCMMAPQLGITPNTLNSYEKKEFTGFQGSFYKSTKEQVLINNPDTVTAYVPVSTNSMKYCNEKGQMVDYKIVSDVSGFQSYNKYSTFIAGDNSYSEIVNPKLNDGSSCLVIKESFGNALVPFLVDHYQYVYVVDYRHFDGTILELVDKKNIKNVIMINNIVATTASDTLAQMKKVCR
ncbi:MAG: hypothetical protein IJB96_05750 [Lachnospira sp.]|nr:hypothetical protein [Lachnospira sp.]